ncbi:hypothetical protein [Nocardia sp. NBC_00403]
MAAFLWVLVFAAAMGLSFAVVLVLWPEKRGGTSVAEIQRRLAAEQRASQ